MFENSKAYKWFMEYRERLFTFTFALIALIISTIIATGFTFSLEELTKVSFYLKTATNFFIMITLFNTIKSDIIREDKLSEKSDYFDAHKRTNYYVKQIHDQHLESIVDDEVILENKKRYEKAVQRELNRYVHGLEIKDGKIYYGKHSDGTELTEDEFFQIKGIKKKGMKNKIRKCIHKALTGDVYYIQISTYEVLNGFTNSRKNGCDDAEMSFDETKENLKENRNKILSFLAIAVAVAIIGYDDSVAYWWTKIFNQAFVMVSACVSAVMVAQKHVAKMTKIEINRATFLNDVLAKNLVIEEDDEIEEVQEIKSINQIGFNINKIEDENPNQTAD